MGYLLVDQNRSLVRATQMIRIAVEAEPDNVAYRDSLGWALFRRGKYAEAIEHLKKAAFAEEPDPIILDHLGDAFLAQGDGDEAARVWQQALSLIEGEKPTPADQELKRELQRKLKQPVERN